MIKLRCRLLRLATVARVTITRQTTLTSSRIISGPTHFLHLQLKSWVDQLFEFRQMKLEERSADMILFLKCLNWLDDCIFLNVIWIGSVLKWKKKVICDDIRVFHSVIIIIDPSAILSKLRTYFSLLLCKKSSMICTM